MDGQAVSFAKPPVGSIEVERLYSEKDVKELMEAVKLLVDLTAPKFEFKNKTETDALYSKIRKIIKHCPEEWQLKRAANELAGDIDKLLIKELKK